MRPENAPPSYRTPPQALARELAPVITLGLGVALGVLWSLVTGSPLTSSPPYLVFQALLLLVAFVLATRGAPRWSYPWLAFGIVGTQAVLYALVPREVAADQTMTIMVALAGPAIAVLLAAAIAARSWGDAVAFVGLYLAGFYTGLPQNLGQPADGSVVSIEIVRLGLLAGQVTVIGAAVRVWQGGRTPIAVGLLVLAIAVSAIAAGILVPRSVTALGGDATFGTTVLTIAQIVALMALSTFALGTLRRVFAGMGVLAMTFSPASPGDDASDAEDDSPGTEVAPGDSPPARRDTPRRKRTIQEEGQAGRGGGRRRPRRRNNRR